MRGDFLAQCVEKARWTSADRSGSFCPGRIALEIKTNFLVRETHPQKKLYP